MSWLREDARPGRMHSAECAVKTAADRLVDAAPVGRMTAHSPAARAKQADRQRQPAKARSSWTVSNQRNWLTDEVYSETVQPFLAGMSSSAIASRIGVSRWYAGRIRQGYRPHPRHWQALAELTGVSSCIDLSQELAN